MTDEQIEAIAAKWAEKFIASRQRNKGRFIGLTQMLDTAIREALAARTATPYSGDATPEALRKNALRLEACGAEAEIVQGMLAAADKWENDMQYHDLHRRALDHVDAVFQPCNENSHAPILPNFCYVRDDKFEAVRWLAHEFIRLGGSDVTRRREGY